MLQRWSRFLDFFGNSFLLTELQTKHFIVKVMNVNYPPPPPKTKLKVTAAVMKHTMWMINKDHLKAPPINKICACFNLHPLLRLLSSSPSILSLLDSQYTVKSPAGIWAVLAGCLLSEAQRSLAEGWRRGWEWRDWEVGWETERGGDVQC